MNPNWKKFLLDENATFDNDVGFVFLTPVREGAQGIYPVTDLDILTISGCDAASFLQGQITCNINDITDNKSSFGAICNPKGRAIATFLLVKSGDNFLMILPGELLFSVKKRLQMYVLRSKVILTDSSEQLCLIGLSEDASFFVDPPERGFATRRQENITVDFQGRSLVIAEADNAQTLWAERLKQGFQPESSAQWRYLDIISGIPWLTEATSEEFIPQMLNLDKLGGISFTKGCYTGQEIVARTHYLGKAKRQMFLAECACLTPPEPNSSIIDAGTEQSIGKVLYAQLRKNSCTMQIVLQVSATDTDTDTYNLKLQNDRLDKVTLNSLIFPETGLPENV